ncbi:MAG: hypothetical protein L0Y72_07835 [Gemmataceae bacterium]|nr:hypothetical protein [Gemmataceae bacterium]MCI0738939.1 hypothetical protein [Gemmataceae bacterium]
MNWLFDLYQTNPTAQAIAIVRVRGANGLLRNGFPVDHVDAHPDRPGFGGSAVRLVLCG